VLLSTVNIMIRVCTAVVGEFHGNI